MAGQGFSRRVVLAVAIGGTLAVWFSLSSRHIQPGRMAVLALTNYQSIPDCDPEAVGRLAEPLALECWFYSDAGAWRMRAYVSAHRMLIVRGDVTSRDVVAVMARAIVASDGGHYSEILVYSTLLTPGRSHPEAPATEIVIRTRWTPRDGSSTLEYSQPVASRSDVVGR
ncbi:MAG: hypothetical protein AB7I50_01440 [Vicinamibacterales bacterium]